MCGDVRECGPEKSELKRLCRAVPIWVALLAALATTAIGGKAGWLPGMRPPR